MSKHSSDPSGSIPQSPANEPESYDDTVARLVPPGGWPATGWPKGRSYVLWVYHGNSAVLVRKEVAERAVQVWTEITTASSWGQVREVLLPGEFERLGIWEANGGDCVYVDDPQIHFGLSPDAFWVRDASPVDWEAGYDPEEEEFDGVFRIEPWTPVRLDELGFDSGWNLMRLLPVPCATTDFPVRFLKSFGDVCIDCRNVMQAVLGYVPHEFEVMRAVLAQHGVTLELMMAPYLD